MINKTTSSFSRFSLKHLSKVLLFSTALMGASFSANALAQSLPDISPQQIADDVEKRYDSRTGEVQYIAASFDPFESDTNLAGSASLRSADEAIAIDGTLVQGGAFLDIEALYTTKSADSFDVKGLEEAVFLSGFPARTVRYDRKTLDCSKSTNVISYDNSYFRGASYGYVAGLYRLFPRYRGHRDFGWNQGRWNPGLWGDWRRSSRSHSPRYRADNQYRQRDRHDDARQRRRHNSNLEGGVRPDNTRSDETRSRRSRAGYTRGSDRNTTRNTNRNTDRNTDRDTNNNIDRNTDRMRDRRRNTDDETRRTRGHTGRNENTPHVSTDVRTPRSEARQTRIRTPRVETPRTQAEPRVRRNTPKSPRGSNAVQTVKSPPQTARPNRARPDRSRSTRPARVNRAVDRTFKNQPPRSQNNTRQNRFYPVGRGYSQTDVVVTYRCVKEEKLTVHIPQDRLDAARFDGLTLLLVDNAGREVPVFVPPNYVEGFRLAAGARQGQPVRSSTTFQYEAPRPSSSRVPIIYGGEGYPQ